MTDPKPAALGFGFIVAESAHHFLVTIPASKKEAVLISEHLTWDESEARRELSLAIGKDDNKLRVILNRRAWDLIADAARVEFNQRLRQLGLKPGNWKTGQTPVSRLLGKELVLLCWAIEDADPALIPTAIKNWLGLSPEERWWLFTMTNAATGHALNGRNRGWRRAVRYALTDNPVADHNQLEFDMPLVRLSQQETLWSQARGLMPEDRENYNPAETNGEKK